MSTFKYHWYKRSFYTIAESLVSCFSLAAECVWLVCWRTKKWKGKTHNDVKIIRFYEQFFPLQQAEAHFIFEQILFSWFFYIISRYLFWLCERCVWFWQIFGEKFLVCFFLVFLRRCFTVYRDMHFARAGLQNRKKKLK